MTACASPYEARPDATISTAPDAPGYIVVGLATQSYKRELLVITEAITLGLKRKQGGEAIASRDGCGSTRGFYGSRPCKLNELDWQVLVAPPGDWAPLLVAEQEGSFSRKRLSDTLPLRSPVHVGPGEVVYIGDYTFASDYEAQEIKLVKHGRDDDAARRALANYPGLRAAPIIYRDPTLAPQS